MLRSLHSMILLLALLPLSGGSAPQDSSPGYGPLGFATVHADGQQGITGGMGGAVVRVTNRDDLARYAGAPEPYIIVVEGRFEGTGLERQRDVIAVASHKTILGVRGAELAGIGLDIRDAQNIIIRNLVIHHADPDGIAARHSHHIWVDHCEIYSEDEPKREDWDGLIDLTQGSSYLTVSYCYIHDHHKACLLNSGTGHFEDNLRNRATYHHNTFARTDQRNPRIGYGLGHVFCNWYQDIGNYAIGFHTQAQVLSENNFFGSGVRRPFAQMYATSTDDASCAFFDDRGSLFSRPIPEGFKYRPTGTGFSPAAWYDYGFALDAAAALDSSLAGPQEGLEHEPILWPGNGATGLPLDTRPRYSTIDPSASCEIFWGTSPDSLLPVELASLQLRPSTTYYWYVRAATGDASVTSPLYRFTTAPARASHPLPADGERNAQLRAAVSADAPAAPMCLSWSPAADAKSYRVFLSDMNQGLDSGLVAVTDTPSVCPGSLRYGATYCWRVDVVTRGGDTLRGDVWTFSSPARPIRPGRTEAEHFARSAYAYLERQDGTWFRASNDSVTVGEAGPGALTGVWAGSEGLYALSVDFWDETSGQAPMWLSVNDTLIDSWRGGQQAGMTTQRVSRPVRLQPGDQIRIDFCTQRKMRCRIDCLDAVKQQ